MSGSFESVQWNACVHRLYLGLYSHPKEFWGNRARTHFNSKGNIPSTGKKFSPEEDRTHDTALSRTANPTHELFRPQLQYSIVTASLCRIDDGVVRLWDRAAQVTTFTRRTLPTPLPSPQTEHFPHRPVSSRQRATDLRPHQAILLHL